MLAFEQPPRPVAPIALIEKVYIIIPVSVGKQPIIGDIQMTNNGKFRHDLKELQQQGITFSNNPNCSVIPVRVHSPGNSL